MNVVFLQLEYFFADYFLFPYYHCRQCSVKRCSKNAGPCFLAINVKYKTQWKEVYEKNNSDFKSILKYMS